MSSIPTAPKCPIVPGVRIMSRKRLIDGNYNHFADAVSPEIAEWMRDAINQHDALLARCKAMEEALRQSEKFIRDYLRDSGGCDHSVGICECETVRLLDSVVAALAAKEGA